MSQRKEKLDAAIAKFMRQYQRKKYPGWDPNDRGYDRELEEKLKRMSPEELAEFLNGTDEPEQK